MYYESIEEERKLVSKLLEPMKIDMKNGDKRIVCKCPKCNEGDIVCKAVYGPILESSDGRHYHKYYKWDEYCELCGEEFDINRIKSDIFFNRPFTIADELNTPLGIIKVYKNDTPISFKYREDKKVDVWGENRKTKYSIPAICVELDFADTEIGDTLSMRVNELQAMEFYCSDEYSLTYYYEDDSFIMGISMFDTFPDCEEWCCYQNIDTSYSCSYKVIRSPIDFSDIDFYRKTHVEIAIVLIEKSKYSDYDDVLDNLDILI